MTSQYGTYTLHAGLARLQTRPRTRAPTRAPAQTHRQIYNTCCFSTATVVTRTRLIVIRTLPVLFTFSFTLHFIFVSFPLCYGSPEGKKVGAILRHRYPVVIRMYFRSVLCNGMDQACVAWNRVTGQLLLMLIWCRYFRFLHRWVICLLSCS